MNHRTTFIPSPEVDLLLTCARLHVDTSHIAHARRLAEDNSIDWTMVYALAQRHGVTPLLARHLPLLELPDLPTWLPPRLQGDYATTAQHNLLRARALVSLARRLREDGIPALFYKGALNAVTLYGDLGLRPFGDVDVLIRPADLWRVRDLLLTLGYTTDFQPAAAIRAQRENHEWHFHHAPSRLMVDLHWHVVPDTFAALLDEDALWARAEDVELLPGAPVTTLCALDQLLMLGLNGVKTCWHDLKGIGDVAAWLHRHVDVDWEESWAQMTRLGSRRVMLVSVYLAHRLLDAPASPMLRRACEDDAWVGRLSRSVAAHLWRTPPNRYTTHSLLHKLRIQLPVLEYPRHRLAYLNARLRQTVMLVT